MDMFVECIIPILDDNYVHVDDISDYVYIIVEFSVSIHITNYSLATTKMEEGIDHETLDIGRS